MAAEIPAINLITIPRAVLSVAAGVVDTVERAVVGDARVRTARGNAWDAICADRARARTREEMQHLVATLAASMPGAAAPSAAVAARLAGAAAAHPADQRSVGSSPRSRASQADLVSIGPAGD